MNAEEKISKFLKEQKIVGKSKLSNIKISKDKNKNDQNLFYIRASILEKQVGINYSNSAIYYAFNQNGEYVGCVKVNVSNMNPPSQIEIEYWANEQFKNQGNMTILAKEVIKEIFVETTFDGLKVRDGFPTTNINSIVVSINNDNYPSLAVARKLGFDEQGCLEKSKYLSSQNISTGLKH